MSSPFSANPRSIDFTKHKTTFVIKTVITLQPANMPGVQSSHIFSTCTILKPASSIQDRVSRSQRHPLNTVGQMSDFDTICWTRYWRVHGFPIRKNSKEILHKNNDPHRSWREFSGVLKHPWIGDKGGAEEIADFPPLWPGLYSWTLYYIWVEFGRLAIVLAPRVFLWFLQFFWMQIPFRYGCPHFVWHQNFIGI